MIFIHFCQLSNYNLCFSGSPGLQSLRELLVLKLRGNKFNHTLSTHGKCCKLFFQEETYGLEKATKCILGFSPKNVSFACTALKDLKKLQELDLSDNGFTNLDHGRGKICIESETCLLNPNWFNLSSLTF